MIPRTYNAPSVYFVRRADGVGPVKIGCSEHPEGRLSTLMTWSPYPLAIVATIPGDEKLERRFHALFADSHSHREWFLPSQELEAVLTAIRAGVFDVSVLPEGKCVTAKLAKPLSEESLARSRAIRTLKKLDRAGVDIPEHVRRAAGDLWYKVSSEDVAKRVAIMQRYLAEREAA